MILLAVIILRSASIDNHCLSNIVVMTVSAATGINVAIVVYCSIVCVVWFVDSCDNCCHALMRSLAVSTLSIYSVGGTSFNSY